MNAQPILVPTDFSSNAYHALLYAIEINKKIQEEIVLFHSYEAPLYANEVAVYETPSAAELKAISNKSIEALKEKISKSFPQVIFRTLVSEGSTSDEIIHAQRKTNAGLVVMGTTGASGLKETLLGTQTELVSRACNVPMIAVPAEARLLLPHRVVFATSFQESDMDHLLSLLRFLKPFGPEVILLHVSTGTLDKTFEYARIADFKSLAEKKSAYPSLSFKLLEGVDTIHDINRYLEEVIADLLVLNKRDRSFFQKMISKSITKKMVYHTHIPLMVLHD